MVSPVPVFIVFISTSTLLTIRTKNFVNNSCKLRKIIKNHHAKNLCSTVLPFFGRMLSLKNFQKVSWLRLIKITSIILPVSILEGKQKTLRKNTPTITFAFVTVIENVLPGIPSQSGQREVNLCWAPYPTNTVQEVHIPIPCSDNILYKNIPKVSRFVFLPKGGGRTQFNKPVHA